MSKPGDFVQRCVDCNVAGSGYVADSVYLDDKCFLCGGIVEGFLILKPVDNFGKTVPKTTSPHLAPPRPGRGRQSHFDLAPLSPPYRGEVGGQGWGY